MTKPCKLDSDKSQIYWDGIEARRLSLKPSRPPSKRYSKDKNKEIPPLEPILPKGVSGRVEVARDSVAKPHKSQKRASNAKTHKNDMPTEASTSLSSAVPVGPNRGPRTARETSVSSTGDSGSAEIINPGNDHESIRDSTNEIVELPSGSIGNQPLTDQSCTSGVSDKNREAESHPNRESRNVSDTSLDQMTSNELLSNLPPQLAEGFGSQLKHNNTTSTRVIDTQPRSSGTPHGLPNRARYSDSNADTPSSSGHSSHSCLPQFDRQN
jgi:hypothetical protein